MASLKTWKSGKDNPPGMYNVKGKGVRYWTGTKWRLSKPTAYNKVLDAVKSIPKASSKGTRSQFPSNAKGKERLRPADKKAAPTHATKAQVDKFNKYASTDAEMDAARKEPTPKPQTTAATPKPKPLPKKQTTQEVKKAGNDPLMVWAKANAKMIEKSGTPKQKELLKRYKKHGLKKASNSLKVNAKNAMEKYSGIGSGNYGNAAR